MAMKFRPDALSPKRPHAPPSERHHGHDARTTHAARQQAPYVQMNSQAPFINHVWTKADRTDGDAPRRSFLPGWWLVPAAIIGLGLWILIIRWIISLV